MRRSLSLFAATALLASCSATTRYRPTRAPPGELALAYDDEVQVWNGSRQVAQGPRYEGLSDFMRCVPDARRHAEVAQSAGGRASILAPLSVGFAVVGLGGFAGLAYRNKDNGAMGALLLGGVALEIAAVVMAGSSFSAKAQAQGHALDAVNYYNDAVGSRGGTCPGGL